MSAPVLGRALGYAGLVAATVGGGVWARENLIPWLFTPARIAPPTPAPQRAQAPMLRQIPPTATAEDEDAEKAVETLLTQAQFWRTQYRPELAWQAATRALRVAPTNPEALALATQLAIQMDQPELEQLQARWRAVAPEDSRLAIARSEMRGDVESSETLNRARTAARGGRTADALVEYRRMFRGGQPLPSLAAEYYQVLASVSEAGHQQAIREIPQLLRSQPLNTPLKLALAQLQTYREDSRSQGIEGLQQLADDPAAAIPARSAWRQALLWMGDEPETAELIETYLQMNAADAEISAKLTRSTANQMSPATMNRLAAWNLVAEKKLGEAEDAFRTALLAQPSDPESTIGLAIIRRMQGRGAEAKRLLDQAVALAPDRSEEFTRAFGANAAAATGGGDASPITQAWQALNQNRLDEADRLARRALQAGVAERPQAEVVLGQIALLREDLGAAEQRFRAALALRPQLPAALAGLYGVLLRQNRIAEAEMVEREPGFSQPAGQAGRAYALRTRAFAEPDLGRREALLREAMGLDAANPWVRLDLARVLRALGKVGDAQVLEAALGNETSSEGLAAAALLAMDQERPGDAVLLLERVPVRLRSADMARMLVRARMLGEVQSLARQVGRDGGTARARLLVLAGSPDPGGLVGSAVVRAFGRASDARAMALATRDALAANGGAADTRMLLAAALMGSGQSAEAEHILAPLEDSPRLNAEQRRQLATLREVLSGATAAPLTARPQGTAGRGATSRQAAEAALRRNPADRQARLALLDLALAEGNLGEAETLLAGLRQAGPTDPQVMQLEARLAMARQQPLRARQLLETALRRQQQVVREAGGQTDAALASDLLNPLQATRRVGEEPRDPLMAELVRDLGRAREQSATWLQAGGGARWHSGTVGMGRLSEVTAPIEASVPVTELGGRVFAQGGAVSLDNGGGRGNALFGTNVLAHGTLRAPERLANGGSVGLGYAQRNLRVDLGSTPLGFERTNIVGGVDAAAALGGGFSVRLSASRRAVTESMLSYAGQRDPRTGRAWGGVVRSGGHVDLAYALNERVSVYGGGGAAMLDGSHVAHNSMVEGGGGATWTVLKRPNETLMVGVDGRYAHYDRNLGGFSWGQGGYFSPQSSVSGAAQVDWRRNWDALSVGAQASVGYQHYRTRASDVFPNDPALQAQLAQQRTVPTAYAAQSKDGVIGGVAMNMEYALDRNLRLGVAGRYNRSGSFTEGGGLMYLRWRMDRTGVDLAPLLADVPLKHPAPSWPLASTLQDGAPEPVRLMPGSARPQW